MSRIYLSAGHHLKDPGACANGVQENLLTIELRDLIVEQLTSLNAIFQIDKDTETLAEYLRRIQPDNESVVCEIHFNAAANPKATGIEVLIADFASPASRKLASILATSGSKIMGITNRGVKTESESHRGRLGLMRKKGKVVLIEVAFISNILDLEAYNKAKSNLAIGWASILMEHSGS